MSDIDPEKLEKAIEECEEVERRWGLNSNQKVLLAAARTHPARLPRYKEVEVVQFVVIDNSGDIVCTYQEENERLAQNHVVEVPGSTLVRLTGTAKVKVTP